MFHLKKKKAVPKPGYDPAELKPVIRSSICTGEKVAGFKDKKNGTFREVMLIRDEKDLVEFRKKYGIEGPIETVY